MNIVITPAGSDAESFLLDVTKDATIDSVRAAVAGRLRAPAASVRLVFGELW